MLRRSKSAALELAFPGNDPRGLPLLFEQMDRIGSLTLVSMKTSELKILSTRLSCKDAKALHSLTITGYRSEKPYTFSADFLRNGTPVLTNLYLDRSILAWDSPLFRGLRSFTFISDSGGYRPTEMQLLGALMGMRSIETLHLVDALPEVLDSTISKIIHLPNLIHLDITDESFRCFHFLDHISLSSATKVAMTCRTNSHGNNHAHSLFNQLPRIVAYVSSRCRRLEAVKGLTIDCRGPVFDSSGVYGRKIDLTIACYSSVQGEILADPCLDPDFKLCMELAFRYNDSVGEVVESLLGAVPLAEVAALRVEGDRRLSVAKMASCALECTGKPLLTGLGIPSLDTSSHSHGSNAEDSGSSLSCKLPSLRSVHLDSVEFGSRLAGHSEAEFLIDSLIRGLRLRAETGVGISKLVLRYCRNLSEDRVAELRAVVENVDWDG